MEEAMCERVSAVAPQALHVGVYGHARKAITVTHDLSGIGPARRARVDTGQERS
jgi:hypothetical protein